MKNRAKHFFSLYVLTGLILFAASNRAMSEEYKSGIQWKEPPVVTPGKTNADPPSDAIILFSGVDLSAWENGKQWHVKDGVAFPGKGSIKTKQKFGDCQLHIEWSCPTSPKGTGQGRGNSGVYMMERYEIQIIDSFENKTYFDGQAGAIYKQTPPAVNASRPPGKWNTYDIFWTAPRFDQKGLLVSPAFITATLNGILILNHYPLKGKTGYTEAPRYEPHSVGSILLQDHGDPVRFRNIWVRSITSAQREESDDAKK